jgi:hypothetical protein
MEVFRDLYVFATADKMAAVVEEIEKTMPVGWTRDKAAEAQALWAPIIFRRLNYCFRCTKEGRRSAALLALSQKDPSTFFVSNIIPLDSHQLTHAQYNAILEDFFEAVLKPRAENAELRHSLSGAEVGLEHWMSPETANRLRQFSTLANKGTGASHPNDRERWNDFVLSAHRTGSNFDPSTLIRWLVEAEEWPPEIAEQLGVEFKSGRELLAFAEGHKVA